MPLLRHQHYTDEERAVLNGYKDQYIKETTPDGRKQLARSTIFPAIFNYWSSRGILITTNAEIGRRSKVGLD
jgi:hypothetical protein